MIKLQEKISKQKIFEKRARLAEEDAKNGKNSNIHLPDGWEEVK